MIAPADSLVYKRLCHAAKQGQRTKRLKHLIDQGADVDARDESDLPALYYAAARGDDAYVKLLLDSGAKVNLKHEVFMTPIWIAALRGHAKVVQILLRYHAEVTALDQFSFVIGTVMHCAFCSGSVATIECLLEAGVSPSEKAYVSIVALSKLADERYKFPCRSPLEHGDLKRWNRDRLIRCSPILLAVECCHLDLLQQSWSGSLGGVLSQNTLMPLSPNDTWESIIDCGILQTNSGRTGESSWSFLGFSQPRDPAWSAPTLLMWAAAKLKVGLIDHLINAGALVNERDGAGRTFTTWSPRLRTAKFNDMGKCLRRLIEGGASMSMPTKEYETLLQLVVNPDHAPLDPRVSRAYSADFHADVHADCIKSVMESVESEYKQRRTSGLALRYALLHGDCPLSSIKVLCGYGAARDRIEEPDGFLSSVHIMHMAPLQIAIRQQASDAVKSTLIEHGAEPFLDLHQGSVPEFLEPFGQIKDEVSQMSGSTMEAVTRPLIRLWSDTIPRVAPFFQTNAVRTAAD